MHTLLGKVAFKLVMHRYNLWCLDPWKQVSQQEQDLFDCRCKVGGQVRESAMTVLASASWMHATQLDAASPGKPPIDPIEVHSPAA